MSAASDRVEQLLRLGRLDTAEQEARAALAAEPEDAGLLTSLAAVLHRAGRMQDGLAAADAACAADPNRERAHRLRALLLSTLGRHDEAMAAAGQAVQLAPESEYPALCGAQVLRAGGRRREALAEARRAAALNPELADAHLQIGDLLGDLGDRNGSVAAYREALRLDPEDAVARHNLAVEELRAHRPGQALRGLLEAGALDPNLLPVLDNIGAVLWVLEWRLRIWLFVGTVLILQTATSSGWAPRAAAGGVLAVGAVVGWYTTRGLPAQAIPAVRAALRRDRMLGLSYLVLAGCTLVHLATLITGMAALAALAWLPLIGLGLVALLLRVTRRG
jgi:tetratricopeptide (TPR) repeat protein